MSEHIPSWGKLAATLSLRRNLERCLTPVEEIGSKDIARAGESIHAFMQRLSQSRAYHFKRNKELMEAHSLKNLDAVKARILELKKEEIGLWMQCRPDIYPTEESVKHGDKQYEGC